MRTEDYAEARLSRWLAAEAEGSLPDSVLMRSVARARRTPQRRSLWRIGPRSSRRRLTLALAGAAPIIGLAVLYSIGAPVVPGPAASIVPGLEPRANPVSAAPSSSTAPSPTPGPRTFTSAMLGYSITLTSAWSERPTPGRWNGVFTDQTAIPGTDEYQDSSDTYTFNVGATTLRPGSSLRSWASAEAASATPSGCQLATSFETVSLPIGVALVAHGKCQLLDTTDVFIVRGGTGYVLGWYNAPGDDAVASRVLVAALESLR
jgi:hypothetical protein